MTLTVYVQGTIWATKYSTNCWCNSCPPELKGNIFPWSVFSRVPASIQLFTTPEGTFYPPGSRNSTYLSLSCFPSALWELKSRGERVKNCWDALTCVQWAARLCYKWWKRQEFRLLVWWVKVVLPLPLGGIPFCFGTPVSQSLFSSSQSFVDVPI